MAAMANEQQQTTSETREQRRIQVIPTILPRLECNLWVQDDELKNLYKTHIELHNNKLTDFHADSGFDLLNPLTKQFLAGSYSNKYGLGIKMSLMQHASDYIRDPNSTNGVLQPVLRVQPLPFMLVPRSSTGAKTRLRLSNSFGVIDSGYRGELCALVDAHGNTPSSEPEMPLLKLEKGKRSFQIVGFNGYPIHINLVENESDLGGTERGEGGFGSTGN